MTVEQVKASLREAEYLFGLGLKTEAEESVATYLAWVQRCGFHPSAEYAVRYETLTANMAKSAESQSYIAALSKGAA